MSEVDLSHCVPSFHSFGLRLANFSNFGQALQGFACYFFFSARLHGPLTSRLCLPLLAVHRVLLNVLSMKRGRQYHHVHSLSVWSLQCTYADVYDDKFMESRSIYRITMDLRQFPPFQLWIQNESTCTIWLSTCTSEPLYSTIHNAQYQSRRHQCSCSCAVLQLSAVASTMPSVMSNAWIARPTDVSTYSPSFSGYTTQR